MRYNEYNYCANIFPMDNHTRVGQPSLPQQLWRCLPARLRRRAFANVTGLIAPRPDPRPQTIGHGLVVAGELTRPTGLGENARLLAQGASALGLPVSLHDLGSPIEYSRVQADQVSDTARHPLLLHVNGPLTPFTAMRMGRAMLRDRVVVGHWSWELPVVPPDWHAAVPFVHEVWAPSQFAAAAFEPLMPGRVRVVRPPMALVPPRPARLDRHALGLPTDAVVVLLSFNLASSYARKNPLAAIQAFRQAFGDRTDRLLLIKTMNDDHFPADMAELRAAVADAPNIRIESRILPTEDHLALVAAADIVLTLHRSEGFGLIAAEAMLLGRPVVATAWSGNLEFMDETSAALVPFRLVPPVDPRGVLDIGGTLWADPDIGVAAEHLRRLADDASARDALGARGRRVATDRLGPESLIEALESLGLWVPRAAVKQAA